MRSCGAILAVACTLAALALGHSAQLPHSAGLGADPFTTVTADAQAVLATLGTSNFTFFHIPLPATVTAAVLQVSSPTGPVTALVATGTPGTDPWPTPTAFTWRIIPGSGADSIVVPAPPAGAGLLVAVAGDGPAVTQARLSATTLSPTSGSGATAVPLDTSLPRAGVVTPSQGQVFNWTSPVLPDKLAVTWAGTSAAAPLSVYVTNAWNGTQAGLPSPATAQQECVWGSQTGAPGVMVATAGCPGTSFIIVTGATGPSTDLVQSWVQVTTQSEPLVFEWGTPTMPLLFPVYNFGQSYGHFTLTPSTAQQGTFSLTKQVALNGPNVYIGMTVPGQPANTYPVGTPWFISSQMGWGWGMRYSTIQPNLLHPCTGEQAQTPFSCNATTIDPRPGQWGVQVLRNDGSTTADPASVPISLGLVAPSQHAPAGRGTASSTTTLSLVPLCTSLASDGSCATTGDKQGLFGRLSITVPAPAWEAATRSNGMVGVALRLPSSASSQGITDAPHKLVNVSAWAGVCGSSPDNGECGAGDRFPEAAHLPAPIQLNKAPFKAWGDQGLTLQVPAGECDTSDASGTCTVFITVQGSDRSDVCRWCMGLNVGVIARLLTPSLPLDLPAATCMVSSGECYTPSLPVPPTGHALVRTAGGSTLSSSAAVLVQASLCTAGNVSLWACDSASASCGAAGGSYQQPWTLGPPAITLGPGAGQETASVQVFRGDSPLVAALSAAGGALGEVSLTITDSDGSYTPTQWSAGSQPQLKYPSFGTNGGSPHGSVDFATVDTSNQVYGTVTSVFMVRSADVRAGDLLTTPCGLRRAWQSHLHVNGSWAEPQQQGYQNGGPLVRAIERGHEYLLLATFDCQISSGCSIPYAGLGLVSLPAKMWVGRLVPAHPATKGGGGKVHHGVGVGGILGIVFGLIGLCAVLGLSMGYWSAASRNAGVVTSAPLLAGAAAPGYAAPQVSGGQAAQA